MNWTKLLYVLIITILYVPMVFLGANVFFPKYTGSDSWYQPTTDCYLKYQSRDPLTAEERTQLDQCLAEQRVAQQQWEEERRVYNGWKYFAITAFTLAILLFAIFVPLMDVVQMGLFFGSVVTAFIATVNYWDYARTPWGFILMLIVFFVVLFFINKRAKTLHDWKKSK